MSDEELKSAYELAMERLREKDAGEGAAGRLLTDAQKAAIAEARSVCTAKLAELEILHRSRLAGAAEPEARQALEEAYRLDVQRITNDRDSKIEKIRKSN